MDKQIKQCVASAVLLLGGFGFLAPPLFSHAQSNGVEQDLPSRDQAYFRNLTRLSAVIGSAHAVRVACNGVDDQYWRSYMQQILGLEASERGNLRSSMVDAFNRGYQQGERRSSRCTAESARIEAEYAREGKRLSDALAAFYFPS
ncbi:MAG: TIGR02301 family protein [Hyphomonadaceae bacterium]